MFEPVEIVSLLDRLQVTHVVTLPDSTIGRWEPAIIATGRIRLIRVCREGEAWGVAAGLFLGGASPFVTIQCTGLFESGDALRNALHDWKLPIPSLIGYRSYFNQETLPGDTCLVYTEPILRAWGLNYLLVTEPDLEALAVHYETCRAAGLPGVALLGEGRGVTATGMELRAALTQLRAARQDRDVVVTTMGPAREWMALGPTHPLDLVLVPSAMGHATSWGLGLALARPDHRVIVVNGDGSMLMNLGSLVTIMAERPPNLIVIVCDNGGYEVTGAQPTPGATAGRVGGDRVDFLALARGAGFEHVLHCPTLEAWNRALPTLWDRPGPGFVLLDVQLVPETPGPRSPGPAGPRGLAFMAAFRTKS